MSRCPRCRIEIADNTEICPLCQSVLETDGETYDSYPDIYGKRKKLRFLRRILSFLSIAAISLCLFIDYHTEDGMYWSIIASGAILLSLFIFLVMSNPNIGYRGRIIHTMASCFLYMLLVDYVTGFSCWSINIVLPGVLFLLLCVAQCP